MTPPSTPPTVNVPSENGLRRELGLYDSTMVVAGSMIGSGIFLVSAEMSRQLGSPGLLIVAWLVAGALTLAGALSYGELAAMMPWAGGQYVYLREAFSPREGFLYGWTLLLVIQTGTIAAVAVGFARYLGVIVPAISEQQYLVAPIAIGSHYAVSLSTAQGIAVLLIAILTLANTQGIKFGKQIQNVFTTAKLGSLLALIALAMVAFAFRNTASESIDWWTRRGMVSSEAAVDGTSTLGLILALCMAQTGALFAADAWNNITFTAGEVRDPKRNVPLSLAIGTGLVIALYVLANLAYLITLNFAEIQTAPGDRVATATLTRILPGVGTLAMALAIMVSTFGAANGLILSGSRVVYAMARDRLFFRVAGELNSLGAPTRALLAQGVWAAMLVIPRTYDPATAQYGNLYSNLLDYVISAALLFYILTILAVFRLRKTRPNIPRPYIAFGYPIVPALYVVGAGMILAVLLVFKPATTWPGLAIVIAGLPVYALIARAKSPSR